MTDADAFIVDLDGFEGPLDLLLSLARSDKLDLREISIGDLAEQYLAYIAMVRRANLEVAAEYLVMAAWLAYLKSRLLLPAPPEEDEPSAEALADALARQLRCLDTIRRLGGKLMARPQRGRDVFPRGMPEDITMPVTIGFRCELFDLLAAYGRHLQRERKTGALELPVLDLYAVDDAIQWMLDRLNVSQGWESLSRFLPEGTLEGLRTGEMRARSGLASTFVASLELARQRVVALRQVRPFGPIALCLLKQADAAEADRE
ncbi:MAG: ScpA family protein [Rhodospirillales bacterium]